MKLISLEHLQKNGDADKFKAIFERNCVQIEKTFLITRLAERLSNCNKEITYQLMKMAKEADRDIAYKLHGNDWSNHLFYEKFWQHSKEEILNLLNAHTV